MSYYQQCSEGTGAFGRHELVAWLNYSLGLNVHGLEQASNGAAACQLIDILHPEASVKMHKVNFDARDAYEKEKNYKVLQLAFAAAGIAKKLEVPRLIEGKPMALLEFWQWFHFYWAKRNGDTALEYYGDAAAKRRPGSYTAVVAAAAASGAGIANSASFGTKKPMRASAGTNAQSAAGSRGAASSAAGSRRGIVGRENVKVDAMKEEIARLKVVNSALSAERDFLFGKLRDLEVALDDVASTGGDHHHHDTDGVLTKLRDIMSGVVSPTASQAKENYRVPDAHGAMSTLDSENGEMAAAAMEPASPAFFFSIS